MKKYRLLCFVIIVATFMSIVPNIAFGAEEKEILLFMDFESDSKTGYSSNSASEDAPDEMQDETQDEIEESVINTGMQSSGFDSTSGSVGYITQIDDEHGKSYAISAGVNGMKLYKQLNKTVYSGQVLVSLEIRKTDLSSLFYIRMVNKDSQGTSKSNTANMYNTLNLKADKIGFYTTAIATQWNVHSSAFTYSPDLWYKVNMWVDLDGRKIHYYVNNEYMGSAGMDPNFTSFKGIWFIQDRMTRGETLIDNFSAEKVGYARALELSKQGIGVPDDILKKYEIAVSSKEVGNVFTSFDETELNISLKNKSDVDSKATIEYKVCDSTGEEVWKHTVLEDFSSGESKNYDIKPVVSRYDIYTLYISVTDEGGVVCSDDRQFSIVHSPTPGYKNHRYGMNMHTRQLTKTDDDLAIPSYTKIGAGLIREVFSWAGYDSGDGTYGFKGALAEYYEGWFKYLEENNLEMLATFLGQNAAYGASVGKVVASDEGIAALEEAAYHAALEYKDKIKYWEFTNEPDFARYDEMSYEHYAKVLNAFYRGIKRGNPDALVLGMGVSRANAGWIEKIIEAGGMCDAVGIHPYQGQSSPEGGNIHEYVGAVREMLEKNGWNHEIWITEGNTSSSREYSTEQQQGTNLVRHYTTNEIYNYADRIITYQYQTDDESESNNESCFGTVRGWAVKNAYGAKPAYLYASNYFACTENAKYDTVIQEDGKYILKYDKPDGGNVFIMYAAHAVEQVALMLGSEKGILRDGYGNPTEIHSIDGVYTFTLTDEPVYFETTATSFELCSTPKIQLDNVATELTNGSVARFNVTTKNGEQMSISGRDEYKLTQTGDYSFEVTRISTPEIFEYSERDQVRGETINRDYVEVTLSKDDKIYAKLDVAVNYVENLIDGEMNARPYSDNNLNRWVVDITVRNNTDKEISGWVNLLSPEIIAEYVKPKRIENLKAGEEIMFSVNIPPQYVGVMASYKAEFVADTGEKTDIYLGVGARSHFYKAAQRTKINPLLKTAGETKIDGIIDETEWNGYEINAFDKSQVSYGAGGLVIDGVVEQSTFGEDADYGGAEDFSGIIYAKWDEEYLYAAAVVKDDLHYQKETPVRMYLDDCFYVITQPTTNQRHDTRIDMALSENIDGATMYTNWTNLKWVLAAGVIENQDYGNELAIVRRDKATIYEAKIPWTLLHDEPVGKNTNMSITFALRDFDGDRDKSFSIGSWYCLVEKK